MKSTIERNRVEDKDGNFRSVSSPIIKIRLRVQFGKGAYMQRLESEVESCPSYSTLATCKLRPKF